MLEFYYQLSGKRRKRFRATGTQCSIGSARGNDLVLRTRNIAKRHAIVRIEDGELYLKDLGSARGCWVNDVRVVDHGPLLVVDEIRVGDVRLHVHSNRTDANLNILQSHTVSDIPTLPTELFTPNANEVPLDSKNSNAELSESGRSELMASMDKRSELINSCLAEVNPDQSLPDNVSGAGAPVQYATTEASGGIPNSKSKNSQMGDLDTIEALNYWGHVVHKQLLQQMDLQRNDVNQLSDEQLHAESSRLIRKIVRSLESQYPATLDVEKLYENVLNESVGLGPIEQFLQDAQVSEVMVNGCNDIYVERCGKLERTDSQFSSDSAVRAVIDRIITPLGKRIDESRPIADARLRDGSRVNAVIPPLALNGPCLTIRKFPEHQLDFSDLVSNEALSKTMVDFLKVCVESRRNMLVSGGTGSGKTTLLNVLSQFIPDSERIVTIEDAAELRLSQPNLVSMESRPANPDGQGEVQIRDLVKNALRMRPDRIVVGECRGGEALDMLQAMNTGHDGSLTTLHANAPRDALSRLEVMVLMAGMDIPVAAIREQMSSAIDVIIQMKRFACGSRKITRITEIVGMESGTIQVQDLFGFASTGYRRNANGERSVRGSFNPTGAIPGFFESLCEAGNILDLGMFANDASEPL